ncbi:hypothetical protein FOPG_16996 [Fusarium oxysporum f. sp. conglutinans race 2 54008]|uniref:Rhodopsin domain-containing protein n=1 Tax=Fusarium oxysporum f. sp. conglutinans race 2 54008 TaxID=1089457 RepID=X0GTD6_FUSOX|nr:hypothetical protein FOPG_16996 [Fusarium oxysporum f. sp. conglutinans race 2 54008]
MAQFDPNVLASASVTLGVAALALVCRLVARRMTKMSLWFDDYLAIFAFLFAASWSAMMITWTIHAGLGRRLEDVEGLTPKQALQLSHLLLWNAELFYASSLAFSKLSILGFYWRLFSRSNIRVPIQILAVLSLIWLIIRTFLAIFHCVPVQAFWDKSIKDAVCTIDDSKFFFGTVLVHLLLDISILALPVLQVMNLHLKAGQKIAVIALFMFGILVCVASIVVLAESLKFDPSSDEMPLDIAPIMIWATVEANLAIVSEEVDESSSIHQLADSMQPGSHESDGELINGRHGLQTVISSNPYDLPSSADSEGDKGIHVRKETSVRIELSTRKHP